MRGALGLGLLVAAAFGACSPFSGESAGDGGAGGNDAASGVDADVADALSGRDADIAPGLDSSVPDACAGTSVFAPGLQAYWQFENNLNDSTCNGRTLSPTVDCPGGVAPYGPGRLKSGFFPDLGNCSLQTTAAALSFGSGDFTVSLWVNRLVAPSAYAHYALIGNGQVFIGAWQTTTGAGLPLYPTIQLMNGTTPIGFLQDTTFDFRDSGHTGVWVHIVAFRSGNTIGLRVNNSEHTTTLTGSALGAADTFYLGREGSGNTWAGTIDEVGIWNRALTPNETGQLYNGGSGLSLP